MYYRIEVSTKPELPDPIGEDIKKDIYHLGLENIKNIRFIRIFILKTKKIKKTALLKISKDILADPISDIYNLDNHITHTKKKSTAFVEIAYLPGVMDPVALTTQRLLKKIGINFIEDVQTRNRYEISGLLNKRDIQFIVKKLLMNSQIQIWVKDEKKIFTHRKPAKTKIRKVNILEKSDKELLNISSVGLLSLNLEEMKKIQHYFALKRRDPVDIELETIAQTWSEHCVHKTFNGIINYNGNRINNLLRTTIMKATEELNSDFCISVFKDNAGIIKFTNDLSITFKVETHNHPSALEPYGGAGTGIGGVIRDTLGTGLGAKPIANTDIFCFGPMDFPMNKLPSGVLHPKRIFKGVIAGVRDYGNRMGIPTVNGAIIFDKAYLYNPVVYCGSIGIIPTRLSFKAPQAGDIIVVFGGKTGKDGIHGVTFASLELDEKSEISSSGAVQIGNPITEKKLTDALLEARNENLYNAITDCGGGGLSSAVGEMGKDLGVSVHLEKVPLKYEGLRYDEIWISESQERMVIAVPKKNMKRVKDIFNKHSVDFAPIGHFENTGKLKLFYNKHKVGEIEMNFLHKGYPQSRKNAYWKKKRFAEPSLRKKVNYENILLKLLHQPNIASKEVVIRQYDHEVQGLSALKPLTGKMNDGPSDGAILRPSPDSKKGIVISCGINPYYGKIDPYWMAVSSIEEAMRNAVSCGGNPNKSAILDNFSWGDVNNPKILGELVRASFGCYDTSTALKVPFISGKDSLNNVFSLNGKKKSILSTLLISCISICDDVTRSPSSDFKKEGSLIYIIGKTKKEMGGSHYYRLFNKTGNSVPKLNFKLSYKILNKIYNVIKKGYVNSIHDCSEGGIGVALAEMSIGGRLGATLNIENINKEGNLRIDELLFSESNSRFIVEIPERKKKMFEKVIQGIPFAQIGNVENSGKLMIFKKKRGIAELKINKMVSNWKQRITW
ncbi:phosphoribosylformylglycinamidine synthase subunit PurL [candidate division WOR-3 bacterium]|nr:phosphoribosylformylglycinamidine synthase subunit PurL [candidate division WOR-3 bacterium]